MSNGISGSFEGWQWGRKEEKEKNVERGADVQLGCLSGIYTGK